MVKGLLYHYLQDTVKNRLVLQHADLFHLSTAQELIQFNGCTTCKQHTGQKDPQKEKLLHMHINKTWVFPQQDDSKIDKFKEINNLLHRSLTYPVYGIPHEGFLRPG